ncbi:MAG: hypothetical protein AAFV43_10165 [Planctomycetota bacterium]
MRRNQERVTTPEGRRIGKTQQAEAAFWRLIKEASSPGFYGSLSLSMNVQDGAIQQVRVATEQTLK